MNSHPIFLVKRELDSKPLNKIGNLTSGYADTTHWALVVRGIYYHLGTGNCKKSSSSNYGAKGLSLDKSDLSERLIPWYLLGVYSTGHHVGDTCMSDGEIEQTGQSFTLPPRRTLSNVYSFVANAMGLQKPRRPPPLAETHRRLSLTLDPGTAYCDAQVLRAHQKPERVRRHGRRGRRSRPVLSRPLHGRAPRLSTPPHKARPLSGSSRVTASSSSDSGNGAGGR
ncbi:hypothetical protein EDB87DRAFT_1687245 [Lactarius vividus]|nr:hypothetical protein EDB87DRAFT_1687245 [Lactarius vividus]